MKKLSLCITMLALFAGATAMLRNDRPRPLSAIQADARRDASAAFRDGLYLGKLAATQGGPIRVAIGRWATDGDRTLFAAGYQQGYHDFLANRSPAVGAARHAD
jgi:hypothetical protein